MPQPVASTTVCFSGDQSVRTEISYWDTPFLVLEGTEGRQASAGIVFEVREPVADVWDLATDLEATGDPRALWNSSRSDERKTVTAGRVGNVIEYWAGGAPGWYGVSQRGRCALYYKGQLRPVGNRTWFSKNNPITVTFLVGANGYVRLMKNNSTVLLNEVFTEKDYLDGNGLGLRATASVTLEDDDIIEFYYVQRTEDSWGGAVLKVVEGDLSQIDQSTREQRMREAPVVGCGFMDSGETVTKRTLRYHRDTEVSREKERAADATFDVPLINPSVNDGTGWEWKRNVLVADDPGYLRYHEGNIVANEFDLKRQRLVQIRMGVSDPETWTVFTGVIDDFQGLSDGTARVKCIDASQRLLSRFDKNFPDKIDYMARNYRRRLGATEPVYEVPAFDNWPLEFAVGQIAYRAGVDASRMRKPLTVGTTTGEVREVQYGGGAYYKFRARGMEGDQIRLERAVNYGNYGQGFRETKAPDDEYIFKPNATRELWARMREFSDRYGYDLRFDEHGDLLLAATNNPSWIYSFTTSDGGGTQGIHPSAHGGLYVSITGGTLTKTVVGARIDLAVGRFSGAGSVNYTVRRVSDDAVMASGSVATASTREEYFYDYRAATDGVNSTVVTLWSGDFDTYEVECTAVGTVRFDSLLAYHTDPEKPKLPHVLKTSLNATRVEAADMLAEMRNFVIVVGRRKATVTDSEKLETNPNNPEQEFVVAAAVDVASITDPTALHYVGQIMETVIYSDGITDDDFASYLARVFIYRYRNPAVGAQVEHTILPFLQLRDPVYAQETRYATVSPQRALFVKSIRHSTSGGRYLTSVDLVPWPEYPSYEPRTDIDIDLNFKGRPVINVEVAYTSLDNTSIVNASSALPVITDDTDIDSSLTGVSPSGTTGLGQTAVPGTIYFKQSGQVGELISVSQALTNAALMPGSQVLVPEPLRNYQSIEVVNVVVKDRYGAYGYQGPITQNSLDNPNGVYYEVIRDNESRNARLAIRYQPPRPLADPRITVDVTVQYRSGLAMSNAGWSTNNPYHRFFTLNAASNAITWSWQHGDPSLAPYQAKPSSVDVKFRRVRSNPYPSGSPFYDPYTSQLGHLVKVTADFLVSGLYRIAVRSIHDNTVVAYLTEPTNESTDPDAHWSYYQAGKDKIFYWDGVDTQGEWNAVQSEDYAEAAQGAFEQGQKPRIGKGFYAWNRERMGGELGPQAYIDTSTVGGALRWGAGVIGTYAGWYLTFECKNDELETIAEAPQNRGNPALSVPRMVTTVSALGKPGLEPTFQDNGTGSTTEAVIWTHLPRPSRVTLHISDWDDAEDFEDNNLDSIDSTTQWFDSTGLTSGDPEYVKADYINNYKPVRIRFVIDPRPGVLWSGNEDEDSVRLIRMAHLKSVHHDQFIVFNGVAYAGSTVEDRQVVTRRLHNDSHTIAFADTNYRKAKTFKSDTNPDGVEWIFLPKYAQKDWTGSGVTSLTFGEPLELEEVPKWDNGRQVAGPRSRFNFGFLAYLWYLSCYTQDRSGRYSWGLNTDFADQTKIVGNTTPVTFPDDPLRQHRRTIVTRQWTDERAPGDRYKTWEAYQTEKWDLSAAAQRLLQHAWRDHDPTSANLGGSAWPTLGTDTYSTNENPRISLIWDAAAHTREWRSSDMGEWVFETNPTWRPNITRDWFPYHLIPPMMDHVNIRNRNDSRSLAMVSNAVNGWQYLSVDSSTGTSASAGENANTGNDPAKGDIWSSAIWHHEESNSTRKRFWPGTRVSKGVDPVKSVGGDAITQNMMDYTRQDDTTHYEEFRGVFSRGQRPGESPRRSQPILPYYINQGRYGKIYTFQAYAPQNAKIAYPNFLVDWLSYFSITFRTEYVWESASLFPTDTFGVEKLEHVNLEHARVFANTSVGNARFDAGAWVGWKDDLDGTGITTGKTFLWDMDKEDKSVFESGFMPIALCTSAPETRELLMHLTLVNERRDQPATVNENVSVSGPPASIQFTPSSTSLAAGQMGGVQVKVLDAGGRELTNQPLRLAVSDLSILEATLFDRGTAFTFFTKTQGVATVTVSIDGTTISGTCTITVTSPASALSITEPPVSLLSGQTFNCTGTAPGYTIVWESSNPFVLGIQKTSTASGEVNVLTGLNPGTATLKVQAQGQVLLRDISVFRL